MRVDDKQLEQARHLPNLQSLDFVCGIGVTDAGMACLHDMPHLRRLKFGDRQRVTHAGLANLRFLTQLRRLDMTDVEMTDADLEFLEGLTQMEELCLGDGVTDAGLAHLRRLTRLKSLDVCATEVTDAGVADLRQVLPDCKIER